MNKSASSSELRLEQAELDGRLFNQAAYALGLRRRGLAEAGRKNILDSQWFVRQ